MSGLSKRTQSVEELLYKINVKQMVLSFNLSTCCELIKNHTNKIFDVWSKLIKQLKQRG